MTREEAKKYLSAKAETGSIAIPPSVTPEGEQILDQLATLGTIGPANGGHEPRTVAAIRATLQRTRIVKA